MRRLWCAFGVAFLAGTGMVCADPGADAAAGGKVFKIRCMGCHAVTEEKNKLGPQLVGVLGRKAGSVEGARYSKAMRESGWTWDTKTLDAYLADPRAALPGTSKVLSLPKAGGRAAIIAYLKSLQPDYEEE